MAISRQKVARVLFTTASLNDRAIFRRLQPGFLRPYAPHMALVDARSL